MTEAICDNKSRDFFKMMKKLYPKVRVAPCVDGHVEYKDIANDLAERYDDLYNSVPSDDQLMRKVIDYINSHSGQCKEDDRVVSHSDVVDAIKHLKANKSDSYVGLMSNHIIISSENSQSLLGMMISYDLTHAYQPKTVLLATIASIPKDNRGNICDRANYKGITICSSIRKLLDIILIMRYKDKPYTSDMQFAFKERHSTVMCSLVVNEVVHYYINNKSDVYSCVDVTKAFDSVHHGKLFELLTERKVPAIILRALLDRYQRQNMRTVWTGKFSRQFSSSNGIRQGGIISPVLFCVYMDALLKRHEAECFGCWIGNHYLGLIVYADDRNLLSSSAHGLRRITKICGEVGIECGVQSNPMKTVCILYARKTQKEKPKISLSGTELKLVDTVKHLGNYLDGNMSEHTEVLRKRGDLVQKSTTFWYHWEGVLMPLLGKHLIPSVHICMLPWLGTSETGLCQISR